MKSNYSSIDRINLKWIILLTGLNLLTWAIGLSLNILMPNEDLHWNYVWGFVSLYIYLLGYFALNQLSIFNIAEPDLSEQSKYKKSTLKDEELDTISRKLEQLMSTQKLYLMENLNLPTLASKLSVSVHNVSQMATTHGQNYMALSITYDNQDQLDKVITVIRSNPQIDQVFKEYSRQDEKLMIYIYPQKWQVSELGIIETADSEEAGTDPQSNARTHGNPEDTTPWLKKVVISKAILNSSSVTDNTILHHLKAHTPLMVCTLDLEKDSVITVKSIVNPGRYGDIPVPLF